MYKKKGKKGVKNKCYSSLIVYVKAGPRGVCALQKTLFGVGVARLDLYREEAALGLCLSPSRLHACRLFLCAREKSSSYEQSFAIYKVFPHTSLCTPVFSSWPPPLCVVASEEEEEEEAFCTAKNSNNNTGWFLRRRRLLHA